MNMNDMLIISTDDHICEPPDLFDKHLEGDLLKSAPKLLTDRNGKNFWSYQGRHQPGIGLNAVVGRPFEVSRPLRAALSWVAVSACGSMSTARTRRAPSSRAATPRMPEPQP